MQTKTSSWLDGWIDDAQTKNNNNNNHHRFTGISNKCSNLHIYYIYSYICICLDYHYIQDGVVWRNLNFHGYEHRLNSRMEYKFVWFECIKATPVAFVLALNFRMWGNGMQKRTLDFTWFSIVSQFFLIWIIKIDETTSSRFLCLIVIQWW